MGRTPASLEFLQLLMDQLAATLPHPCHHHHHLHHPADNDDDENDPDDDDDDDDEDAIVKSILCIVHCSSIPCGWNVIVSDLLSSHLS